METLSERCSHVTQISGVNREAEQKRMCREDGRRDVDEMAVGSAVIARKLYVHVFFSRYPPLPSPSVLLLPHTLHPSLSSFLSVCSPNPTFYPIISLPGLRGWCSQYLSSPCLSSFDQEDSSQDLAAAAQNRARHIRTHRGR